MITVLLTTHRERRLQTQPTFHVISDNCHGAAAPHSDLLSHLGVLANVPK